MKPILVVMGTMLFSMVKYFLLPDVQRDSGILVVARFVYKSLPYVVILAVSVITTECDNFSRS